MHGSGPTVARKHADTTDTVDGFGKCMDRREHTRVLGLYNYEVDGGTMGASFILFCNRTLVVLPRLRTPLLV